MPRIAFLGPVGTFAHAATLATPEARDAELVPMATVTLAVDALRDGVTDGALVPLENSVEGAVAATLDELSGPVPLVIAAETYLPVEFDLMARPGTQLAEVREVATHPHAEAQVRRWLLTTLPQASVRLVGSTAGGAQAVGEGRFDAAVAPPGAAGIYGLEALSRDIADDRGAVTRFVLLTRPAPPPPRTGNDRTSLVAYLREDHSGALFELLSEFATRSVNLTRIESRPTRARLGLYCFSIDAEGHVEDERVGDALAALHRVCADVRFLGSYARRDGLGPPVPAVGRRDEQFADARGWLAAIRTNGQA